MNTKTISDTPSLFAATLNAVPACQTRHGDTDWFPAVDVTEAGQEYVFQVDLPGLKPEEIQLHVDSDRLSIGGQRAPRRQGGKPVRVERPSGAFVRQLPLPPDARGEIHAIFGDGVLELHVPKARADGEPGQARAIAAELEETAP
jgi:HSP20 family molecular chaperone IbpA